MQSITNQTNKEIEEFIEGDYISIEEGESRTFEFDINKIQLVVKIDFNGRPTKRVQLTVKVNPNDPIEQQGQRIS
jgi:hypothetical protein